MTLQDIITAISGHPAECAAGAIILGLVTVKKLELPVWHWLSAWLLKKADALGQCINASLNAAILAVEMLSLAAAELAERLAAYKSGLCKKIEKANEELKELKYEYKTN